MGVRYRVMSDRWSVRVTAIARMKARGARGLTGGRDRGLRSASTSTSRLRAVYERGYQLPSTRAKDTRRRRGFTGSGRRAFDRDSWADLGTTRPARRTHRVHGVKRAGFRDMNQRAASRAMVRRAFAVDVASDARSVVPTVMRGRGFAVEGRWCGRSSTLRVACHDRRFNSGIRGLVLRDDSRRFDDRLGAYLVRACPDCGVG